MRKMVRVHGEATVTMSLDPTEFGGAARQHVRDEILRNLRGIPPEVSFFPSSIDEAVDEIFHQEVDHGGEG